MGQSWTREEFVAKLEAMGESEASLRLGGSVFGPKGSEKYLLVEQWLSDKARSRLDAREAEDAEIAKSARDAALVAAEEAGKQTTLAREANDIARKANNRATIAIVVAIAAVAISGVPIVEGFLKSASPSAVSPP